MFVKIPIGRERKRRKSEKREAGERETEEEEREGKDGRGSGGERERRIGVRLANCEPLGRRFLIVPMLSAGHLLLLHPRTRLHATPYPGTTGIP